MHDKNNPHGGARSGAGRHPIDGPTRILSLRVPVADIEALEKAGVTNLSRFYIEAGKKEIKRLKKKQ